MYFSTSIWIFQVIGVVLIAISETTVVHSPGPTIRVSYNDTVNFKWTSNVSIIEATWGISSGSSASPKYMFVDNTGAPPSIPGGLDENLKRRLHFKGNLAAGRVWFDISNATASDSDTYIGLIREQGSSTKPYYVQVIVGPKPTSVPSTTPSSTSSTLVPSNMTKTSSPSSSTTPHSPTTSKPTISTEEGLSGGQIAGIAVGSMCGGGCVIIIIVVIWKKNKNKHGKAIRIPLG